MHHEEQLGATYLELEWAMKYIDNKSLYGLDERQKEVLLIYKKLNSTNKHKMLFLNFSLLLLSSIVL